MTSFTYLITQLVTVLGHDGEDSRTIYNGAFRPNSPCREMVKQNQANKASGNNITGSYDASPSYKGYQ